MKFLLFTFLSLSAFAEEPAANMAGVLSEARCVPNYENGKPAGLRCFQIVPGSVYDKAGMKDNDVICGINGESLNGDMSITISAFEALHDKTKKTTICIKRDGKEIQKIYDPTAPVEKKKKKSKQVKK